MICGDFAQKMEKNTLSTVEYTFSCEISTVEESFAKGQKGNFLFAPRLYRGEERLNSSILEDTKVIIKVIGEQVSSSGFNSSSYANRDKIFEYNYKITQEEDFLIEVPFEEKPQSVEVSIKTCLDLGISKEDETKKEIKEFNAVRIIQNQIINNGDFNDIYLRYDAKRGYELLVITMDGTLRSEIPVEVTLSHRIYKDQSLVIDLKTDEKGKILLG